jgi:hypothetical protein
MVIFGFPCIFTTPEGISPCLSERGKSNQIVTNSSSHARQAGSAAFHIARFDKQSIADIKRLVDISSLPPDSEIGAEWDAFLASVQRPQAQQNIKRLITFTTTTCMMNCNAQASSCRTACFVPSTPSLNATGNTTCIINCGSNQLACQSGCALTSPSR